MTFFKKPDKINYILFAFYAVVLLFYSFTTSPMTKYAIGSDSAFFQYCGNAMKNGLVMY